MALTVKTELRKEYLYALVEGVFDFSSSIQTTHLILEACARHQAVKVLIDYRTATGNMTDPERLQYAEISVGKYRELLTVGTIKSCRFVWLGKVPLVDPKRLGEAVALNRGMMLRVTQVLDEAFVFLGVKPDIE